MPDPNDIAAMMPLCATLGIEIITVTPDEVRARMDHAPGRCTTFNVMHGGALMALVVPTDVIRADGKPVTRTTQTQAVITRG